MFNLANRSLDDVYQLFKASADRCDWLKERIKASPQIKYWQDQLANDSEERDDYNSLHNAYLIVASEFCAMFKRMRG